MAEVTGRDGFLLAQALALAIETMRVWPEPCRPESDIADMHRLLVAQIGEKNARFWREQKKAILEVAIGTTAQAEPPSASSVVPFPGRPSGAPGGPR